MSQYIMPLSETMKANVDLILNDAVAEDTPNSSSIQITERPTNGSYFIECTFFGDDRNTGERFEVVPFEVRKLTILQNFTENYTDEISLVVSIMPNKYLQLYDNSRGLKCSLRFTPVNRNTMKKSAAPTIIKEYLVVFKDKTDIRKKYSKEAMAPNKQGEKTQEQQGALIPDAEFQLIDQTTYNLRKIKFNFQARGVTMRDVILLTCKLCNITQAAVVQPDNTTVYENFLIPPNMSFDQMMVYLQSYYGVYNKGMGFYYTNDVLYVYPLYETNPSTPESAHLYYVGNNYTGNDVNHAMAGTITHIILNGFAKETDLQDSGAENDGTTLIVQDATRIIDRATTIMESGARNKGSTGLGPVSISELNTNIFAPVDMEVGMTYNAYQPMFRFDDSNSYKIRTDLNSYRRAIVYTKWEAAVPFTFKPGYRLYYHYDSEDLTKKDSESDVSSSSMYTTKTGICSAVTYVFLEAGRHGSEFVHSCSSDVILSLQHAPANSEPTGETITNVDAARATKEVGSGGLNTAALASSTSSLSHVASSTGLEMNAAGTGPKVGIF